MKIVHSTISHKRAVLLLFILTTIGAGFGSAQAAEDGKAMPGTYCRTAVPNSQDAGYLGAHSIYNKSKTRRLNVYCPIIRDLVGSSGKLDRVHIHYQNPNPTGSMYCYVYVRRVIDGRALSQLLGIGKRSSEGMLVIPVNKASGFIGSYTLNCSLPPNPGVGLKVPNISMIYIQESD